MNVFIYDTITEKYQKKVKKFEEEINKLNLQGKIVYLKNTKDYQETIEKEIRNGAKTIITLGNDKIVNTTINILSTIDQNISLFTVPIGDKNDIANSLGIKNEKESAFILSARRIEKIKIGKINDLYFLSNCCFKNENTILKINESYNIFFNKNGESYIFNILDKNINIKQKVSPQDNNLNLFININSKDKSIFQIKNKININNNTEIIVDNCKVVNSPAEICLSNKEISFIVGKDRSF